MNSEHPFFDLYEKLYFHEIEMREKLSGRLQTPLALIVSLTGVLAFMLQNAERGSASTASFFFLGFLAASSVALASGVYFFVRSWYGHTYSFLPSARDTENYREQLKKTYSEYENGDAIAKHYLDAYLCRYLIDCSSANVQCNDTRSIYLHRTNTSLIVVVLLALISFLFFYFGDLEKGRRPKPIEIKIVQPVDVQGVTMTDKKPEPPAKVSPPPPPPPPPPTRQIREGVEIVKPQPEKKDGK